MAKKEVKKESSVIKMVSYTVANKTLVITFNTGKQYRYDGVPKRIADGFAIAPSKGAYFWQNIRDKYTTTDITED